MTGLVCLADDASSSSVTWPNVVELLYTCYTYSWRDTSEATLLGRVRLVGLLAYIMSYDPPLAYNNVVHKSRYTLHNSPVVWCRLDRSPLNWQVWHSCVDIELISFENIVN